MSPFVNDSFVFHALQPLVKSVQYVLFSAVLFEFVSNSLLIEVSSFTILIV